MGLLDGTAGIVTGAGSGIGRSIARIAAREGAKVVVADINPKTCEETAALIMESGGKAVAVGMCMKHEITQMLTSGGGSIVNIGSQVGVTGQAVLSAYAAAKGGVIALSKS